MIDERYRPVAIVDDDAAVLESFEFLLEMAGFQVAAYRSAQAFLQGGPIPTSCLIVDQHMPGMTGLELAAKLRDDGVEVPVMLVTSAPSPAIYAKAREIGLRGVMEKPMREDEVIAFIRSCGA